MIVRLADAKGEMLGPSPAWKHTRREKSAQLELSISEYWDLVFKPDLAVSEEDWIQALEEKLFEAVRIRLASDVPLGAFLSGGTDSSSIVALMSRISSQPVQTFSVGFGDQTYDELPYARIVAAQFETQHHEYIVTPNAIEILPKLAWAFDEPFADPSALPTYYVSKMASEEVKVVLSGDGGDEGFAGYDWYSSYLRYQRYDFIAPSLVKRLLGFASKLLPFGMKGKGTLEHISQGSFDRYAGIVSYRFPFSLETLFHQDLVKDIELSNQSIEKANSCMDPGLFSAVRPRECNFLRKYYDGFNGSEELSRLQYVDTKTYLPEDILTKVDRASMLCSLETRAPLLDHELLELAARIPARFKYKKGTKKYIFKKMMRKSLPREILYRKKRGFDMPISNWFKKDFVEYSREILLSKRSRERGILNPRSVARLLETQKKYGRDLSTEIWALVFFENWCLNWLD
jgi:asparagine synthase (glutamine-hydrolysing)